MHGSRSKIPSKNNLVRQRSAEVFNSGVKGLSLKNKRTMSGGLPVRTPAHVLFLTQHLVQLQPSDSH
jgi:hypothetical protein